MNKKSAMGQRIQELRKDAGLTQEQLAQRIGVSMAAVRNYENGLREPNSKAMAALERFFKVSGDFDCSSQERQMLAVSILSGVMETVTTQLLRDDGPADLDGDQFAQIFQAAFALNPQGRTELAKRAAELTQLEQYKR